MGMDQYLHIMKKPTSAQMLAVQKHNFIKNPYDEAIETLSIIEFDEDAKRKFAPVLPFTEKTTLTVGRPAFDRLKSDNGVPENWLLVETRTAGDTHFLAYAPALDDGKPDYHAERKLISVTFDEMDENYTNLVRIEHIVFQMTELRTWRNRHDIHDIVSKYHPCDNCVRYPLSLPALIDIMNVDTGFRAPITFGDEVIVYHAWW